MGSSVKGVAGGRGGGGSSSNGVVDKGVDFAEYFCTYAFLYHQKDMLCDRVRMDAYITAIFKNKHHFHGKEQEVAFLQSGQPKQRQERYMLCKQLRCLSMPIPLLKQIIFKMSLT